ncbi:eukaryotic translation initiation factor 2D [Episyrphus balteatus]|uniref:eukaryotic translation initiation factor 2D n=1 Tax=Episyrphus balteatus TaxID=286459 RepID=UPI002485474D|nr:eukaryotic translation initiation factor 2D [Episyrphus balteatus]
MFLKPYKLKSNAPLKGSDSKRLRLRIQQAFPDITNEQIQQLIPNKSAVTMLKITTHSDFHTLVYCVDKLPMFFEAEGGVLVPTLYTMWIVPDLLPYFKTHAGVLPKLSNGADLMLPGVVHQGVGMNMYGRYKKGQLIAINLTTNDSAVGVGVLTRSSDDLYMCGGHGSAVKMLHIFGDKLWGHEPSLVSQIPDKAPAKLTEDDFPALGTEPVAKTKVSPELPIPKVDQLNANEDKENQNQDTELSENNLSEDLENLEIQPEPEPDAVSIADTILRNAFLTALKHHGKEINLPLLTSNFYRLHVVPEAKTQIDLKKTKYKKLSNFLNEMINEGFIVVREETKGIDKIISIDYDHPELVNFIADAKSPGEDKENGQQPLYHSEMTELYLVTDAVVAFFTKMNFKRGEGISSVQVKRVLREYVSKNNLPVADPVKKSIKLDECLQQICGRAEAPLDTVYNIIISKMKHTYEMRSTKDVPKNKPLIQMSLATRSGNKKVTLVSNIECYGIILPEFIKLCKQGAAASTTIVKVPNQNREMLQVQGNQVRFIFNLLTETYKIPAKNILGLDLAKPVKKKK